MGKQVNGNRILIALSTQRLPRRGATGGRYVGARAASAFPLHSYLPPPPLPLTCYTVRIQGRVGQFLPPLLPPSPSTLHSPPTHLLHRKYWVRCAGITPFERRSASSAWVGRREGGGQAGRSERQHSGKGGGMEG